MTAVPVSLWGSNLMSPDGQISTNELSSCKAIGLFFGALWSKPSSLFIPYLMNAYQEANAKGKSKRFEVVYVSIDRTQEDFDKCAETFDWLWFPYQDYRLWGLKKRYDVKVLPKLIVVNLKGEIITEKGREEIIKFGGLAFQEWAVAPVFRKF